ncbi:MAG TPA: diadenylate cyclase CdaA [Polyangiaceae bacterium]|nr:diadenylate cyclase CdaA [Polyangiaceae bacterium]
MTEALLAYLTHRTPQDLLRDLIDLLVVYYVLYRLLLVARGTRAMQVAAGLAMVVGLYLVAQSLHLVTIVTLVGTLLQSIILVVVVVFQNDIRRALQRVGSRAVFGSFGRSQETEVIDEVVDAARELARHRIGALITFEQDANLEEFIGQNKGIDLDARVSSELLVSLFIPEGSNKLHDGSVIIRSLRVAKAGVFFPMPEGRVFDSQFGSRHRAALGITEETDAVVVVVSEERGTISFCFNGNIASDLQAAQLREMLLSIMNPKVRKKSRNVPRQRTASEPMASSERVSLKTPIPPPPDEAPAPASYRPPPLDGAVPMPLRKSTLPLEPKRVEGSGTGPIVPDPHPRPMPKGEVDMVSDPEDTDHPQGRER